MFSLNRYNYLTAMPTHPAVAGSFHLSSCFGLSIQSILSCFLSPESSQAVLYNYSGTEMHYVSTNKIIFTHFQISNIINYQDFMHKDRLPLIPIVIFLIILFSSLENITSAGIIQTWFPLEWGHWRLMALLLFCFYVKRSFKVYLCMSTGAQSNHMPNRYCHPFDLFCELLHLKHASKAV